MYFQQGGQQAQIMQIIQQYAQMNQIDPKQLMQKLQQMPAEQQQQAIQQMMQTLQQGAQQEQPDMQQAAMEYGGYTTGIFAGGGMIRRADGSYSKRGLWDNIRANKGSGKKPTKEMLKQESKIRSQEAAYGGVYGNGGTNNAGFDALPDYVQAKILSNMGYGGYYNPMSEMADYQQGGQPDYSSILDQNAADAEKYPSAYHKDYVTGYPVQNSAGSIPRPGGFDCPPGYTKYKNPDGTFSCIITNPAPGSSKVDFSSMTKMADDMQFSRSMQPSLASAPMRKHGGSTFSGNAFYGYGGGYIPEYAEMAYGGNTNQYGGLAEGDILDVTPEELQMLKQGGYNFEIIK